MPRKTPPGVHVPVWAYAYELLPAQNEVRLKELQKILDFESLEARSSSRKWEGRLISQERVTHILVVSDTPRQDQPVNRKLEEELKKAGADAAITLAIEII